MSLTTVDVKATGPWRVLEVIGGLIIIALGIIVLADPQFGVETLVFIVAASLVLVGLFRMIIGLFAHYLPERLRILNILGGLAAEILGILALLYPHIAVGTLIAILALALALVGLVEIGIGFTRHHRFWVRTLIALIGIGTVALSLLVVFEPDLGDVVLASILAVALILLGIRNILHGITGHHRAPAPTTVAQL